MATYQLYLAIVPKKELFKKYKLIPEKLKVKVKRGYFYSLTEKYCKLADIKPKVIVTDIDKIVNRANWGNDEFNYNWKTFTDKKDNNAWMSLNKKTLNIKEFSFRADLREKNL